MEIEPLKILAIDPALANVGWVLLNFNPSYLYGEPVPSWMAEKDKTGVHTYRCFERIDGGTFSTDKQMTMQERMIHQVDEIHLLCAIHRPELVAIESQLDVGMGRCTWGVAIQLGIIFPYFCMNQRQVRLARCPDNSWVQNGDGKPGVFTHMDHVPNYGVALKPAQLQSVAHHEGSTKARIVKERYQEVTQDLRKVVKEHEADAYFIGVHAGRFWAVCLQACWDPGYLTKKETKIFLGPETGMINRKLESWWTNYELPAIE